MELPFDGAISRYYESEAPDEIRQILEATGKKGIPEPTYPYRKVWKKDAYEAAMEPLQIELVRLQNWVKATGQRVVIIFEGRDASGKGGTIARLVENLNPRGARIVALAKPTETEARQWYFQRYIAQLPTAGEIVVFDRSWYNRGVVEQVFSFCTPEQRESWFQHVPGFEKMLVEDGIHLFKIWLNVGRATQMQRFLDRESDPLRQWKLSQIDIDGLPRWGAYSEAIEETLARSHNDFAPWTVLRSDDKKRARVNAIRTILTRLPYDHKNAAAIGEIDPLIAGGPELWHG